VDFPTRIRGQSIDGLAPKGDAAFLPGMNGLPVADECHEHTPLWNAATEFQQVIRFALVDGALVNRGDPVGVVRALRFVEHDQSARVDRSPGAAVRLHVGLDVLHECFSAATAFAERVLQHFDQWTVAGEIDRGRRRLLAISRNRQIIEPVSVYELQADQRFARSRNAAQQDQMPRLRAGGTLRDFCDMRSAGSVAARARLIIGSGRL